MQYAYTSESGSRIISDHGSDVLNSQSDEKQFKPRLYNTIKIEDFVYESWPPSWKYNGGASVVYYDAPLTNIVCSGKKSPYPDKPMVYPWVIRDWRCLRLSWVIRRGYPR